MLSTGPKIKRRTFCCGGGEKMYTDFFSLNPLFETLLVPLFSNFLVFVVSERGYMVSVLDQSQTVRVPWKSMFSSS